jgi:hypothetical protein
MAKEVAKQKMRGASSGSAIFHVTARENNSYQTKIKSELDAEG